MLKILLLALFMSAMAMAHSGGTNSQGCHLDHSTGIYHCH